MKTHPPPSIADKIRNQLEDLAVANLRGSITDTAAAMALAERRPDLTPQERAALFEDLQNALAYRQLVHDGNVTIREVEPELADEGILTERAKAAVTEALDDLAWPPEGAR